MGVAASVVAVSAVSPTAVAGQDPEPDQPLVRIAAVVRDLDSQEALPGAILQLSGIPKRYVTDLEGRVSFDAAKGDYELIVAKSGYQTLRGDFSVLRPGGFVLHMSRADSEDPSAPSRLMVRVTDAETGRALKGAAVAVSSGGRRGTNDRGCVEFPRLAPALVLVTVEIIGYASRTEPVALHPGRTTSLEVGMTVEAIELEPITVEVLSPIMESHGVYRRIERGIATRLLTRQMIERQASDRISDALRHVPGLEVRREGTIGFPSRAVAYARNCPLAVWVDGVEWNPDIEGSVDIDQIPSGWVELAEIYWGLSTPPRFSSENDCGAILIWTRQGRRR